LYSVALIAQDSTCNAKLDTVLLFQKKMSLQQDKIYDEEIYESIQSSFQGSAGSIKNDG
jgi:hypothetical protein